MSGKICLVVHNFSDYGGVGVVAANIANELSKEYEVYLLSLLDDGRPKAYHLSEKIHYKALLAGEQRLRNQLKGLISPVRAYFKTNGIDVAIILGHWPAFLVSPARLFSQTRFVFCDHGALMNQWDDKKNTFMRWVASKVSDHTVVLTKRTRDDYIKRFHIRSNKIDFIYNWIEDNPMDSNKYDVLSKRILSVGRFGYEKGFDQLIDIVRPVFEKHPDWHLDIYGDGEMMGEVQERIERYQLDKNVHLMGARTNARELFGRYSFYVLSSQREGLPIVLLEAKCNLLPIISFDVLTGPAEIVRHGKDGILVEANNNEAFTDAINRLIENPDMRARMSGCARGNLDVFRKHAIINQWAHLIEELRK